MITPKQLLRSIRLRQQWLLTHKVGEDAMRLLYQTEMHEMCCLLRALT